MKLIQTDDIKIGKYYMSYFEAGTKTRSSIIYKVTGITNDQYCTFQFDRYLESVNSDWTDNVLGASYSLMSGFAEHYELSDAEVFSIVLPVII